jgi:hypothetical protein
MYHHAKQKEKTFFRGVFHAAISDERQIWNCRQVSRSESEEGGGGKRPSSKGNLKNIRKVKKVFFLFR